MSLKFPTLGKIGNVSLSYMTECLFDAFREQEGRDPNLSEIFSISFGVMGEELRRILFRPYSFDSGYYDYVEGGK